MVLKTVTESRGSLGSDSLGRSNDFLGLCPLLPALVSDLV